MGSNTKKNILMQTIYQIVALLMPFITAPYISRILGPNNVGIYSYTYAIVSYFMLLSMLGIDYYGNRTIASVRDNKEEVNKKFSEIFLSHVLWSILVLFLYLLLCFKISEEYRILALVQSIYIIGELFNINWLFAGLGEFKVTVVRNLIIKTLTIISIFLFVKDKNDLFVYILIMSLGMSISTSAIWIVRHKYVQFVKVNLVDSLKHLKPLFVLYVAIMATSLMKLIDKTMLGSLNLLNELGCYEYAGKIIKMPLSLITSIGVVMISRSSNLFAKGEDEKVSSTIKLTLKFSTIFSSLFVFGFMAYGTQFSKLYLGEDFILTGEILKILAISLLFKSWNVIFRTQYFIPKQKDSLYIIAIISAAFLNVILNYLLIPIYGSMGAAFSTVVAYGLITILELFFISSYINIRIILLKNLLPSMIGIIPLILSFVWKTKFSTNWYGLLIQILLFVVEFTIVLFIYLIISKSLFEIINIFRRESNE